MLYDKGLSERRVVLRHGLRSALTPVVTPLGIDLGSLLGGAIVTEAVFGLQGIRQTAVQVVTRGDLASIFGTVMFAAFFVVVATSSSTAPTPVGRARARRLSGDSAA